MLNGTKIPEIMKPSSREIMAIATCVFGEQLGR